MRLVRYDWRADGIFGRLRDDHDDQLAVTLEHSFDGKPKLPAGQYLCKRGMHQLEHGGRFETFEVLDVPGHTGILFHIGNWNRDSDGCILLGRVSVGSTDGHMITSSAMTFFSFMNALDGVNEFPLTVEDGVPA